VKYSIIWVLSLFSFCVFSQIPFEYPPGELRGKIVDDSTNKFIPFASVMAYQNNSLIRESVSDSIGNYILKNLRIGKYDVLCEKKYFRDQVVRNVHIIVDQISFVNFKLYPLSKNSFRDSAIDTTFYKVPISDVGFVPKCGTSIFH
jgi:hypothetical protein